MINTLEYRSEDARFDWPAIYKSWGDIWSLLFPPWEVLGFLGPTDNYENRSWEFNKPTNISCYNLWGKRRDKGEKHSVQISMGKVKGRARATLTFKTSALAIPVHPMLYALLIIRNFKAISALSWFRVLALIIHSLWSVFPPLSFNSGLTGKCCTAPLVALFPITADLG